MKNKVDILVTPYIREYNGKSVRSKLFDRAGEIVTGTKKNQIYLRRLIGLTGDELGHPARIENLNAVWGKFYKANILNKIEFLSLSRVNMAIFQSDDIIFLYFRILNIANSV